MLEEISLKLLTINNFVCDNKNMLIRKSAEKILKKGIKKIKYKKYVQQWIICKKLKNINLLDWDCGKFYKNAKHSVSERHKYCSVFSIASLTFYIVYIFIEQKLAE